MITHALKSSARSLTTPGLLIFLYLPLAFSVYLIAAITVEGRGIILDLNNMTLRQSQLFNVQQRFYANIELASAPFIPGQGPASFGDNLRVLITSKGVTMTVASVMPAERPATRFW